MNPRHWLLGLLALGAAAAAQAGLVGSVVDLSHRYEARTDASVSVIVADDNSDVADMYLGMNPWGRVGYFVDVDSGRVLVDFYLPQFSTEFTSTALFLNGPPYMNGLLISGLALDARMFKDTATIQQSGFGFAPDRIIVYGDHSVGLDFQTLAFNTQSWLEISFEQPSEVPEPSVLALVLLGTGLGWAARRTAAQGEKA